MSEEESTPEAPKETREEKNKNILAEAKATVDRLEKANAKMAKQLAKYEELAVERAFGGETSAKPPEKKEETPEEYAKRVMRGDT